MKWFPKDLADSIAGAQEVLDAEYEQDDELPEHIHKALVGDNA